MATFQQGFRLGVYSIFLFRLLTMLRSFKKDLQVRNNIAKSRGVKQLPKKVSRARFRRHHTKKIPSRLSYCITSLEAIFRWVRGKHGFSLRPTWFGPKILACQFSLGGPTSGQLPRAGERGCRFCRPVLKMGQSLSLRTWFKCTNHCFAPTWGMTGTSRNVTLTLGFRGRAPVG